VSTAPKRSALVVLLLASSAETPTTQPKTNRTNSATARYEQGEKGAAKKSKKTDPNQSETFPNLV
jgi:hypothetical protein